MSRRAPDDDWSPWQLWREALAVFLIGLLAGALLGLLMRLFPKPPREGAAQQGTSNAHGAPYHRGPAQLAPLARQQAQLPLLLGPQPGRAPRALRALPCSQLGIAQARQRRHILTGESLRLQALHQIAAQPLDAIHAAPRGAGNVAAPTPTPEAA